MNAYQAFTNKFKQVADDTHSTFSRGRINLNQVNNTGDLILYLFGKLMKYTVGSFAGLVAGIYAAISTAISNYFEGNPPVEPKKPEEKKPVQEQGIVPVLIEAEIAQQRIAEIAQKRITALKKQITTSASKEKETQLLNKIKKLLTTVEKQITVLTGVCQPYDAVVNLRTLAERELSEQREVASNAELVQETSVYRAGIDRTKDDVQAYVCVCCDKEQSCPESPICGHRSNVTIICKKSRGWPMQECQLKLMKDRVMVTNYVTVYETRNAARNTCTRIEALLNSAEYQLPQKPHEYLLRQVFMKTRQNLQSMMQGICTGCDLTSILDKYIKELKETATRFSPDVFKINDYLPKSDYAACVVAMHKMKALGIGYCKRPSFLNHSSDGIKNLILSYILSPNFPLHRRLSALPAIEDVPVELTVELIDKALAEEVNNRPRYY